MPPRRRGKAASARAAAIQAVNRKRKAQLELGAKGIENAPNDNHQQTTTPPSCTEGKGFDQGEEDVDDECCCAEDEDYDDESWEDDDEEDEDGPPPLIDNDGEICDGNGREEGDDDEEDDEEDDDDEDDDEEDEDEAEGGGGGSNATSGEGGCLHCHRNATASDIQVRCDECQSYICQTCHWCHEFQANHEIRVCDRCDAFYCRTCDEMDQCDDCGEVVCASCSTLLSCKFCGGGLCEECATACGRCGIVLCSRDAKFAVDCDTCRLSYCLVCLASGSKDPCVRCGHRPSKRMEQLVHLRLKSIYKAFKQSSRTGGSKYGGDGSGDGQDDDEDDNEDNDDDNHNDHDGHSHHHHHHIGKSGDPQTLLQAAASAASKHSSGKGSSHHHNHHHHHHHHDPPPHTNTKRSGGQGGASTNRDQQAKDMVEKYMAEKEKADAAAAALLAELDEEEAAVKSKKKKKKKKKERLQAKKDDETRDQDNSEEPEEALPPSDEQESKSDSDDDIKLAAVTKEDAKKNSSKDKSKRIKADRKKKMDAKNNKRPDPKGTTTPVLLADKSPEEHAPAVKQERMAEVEKPQIDAADQRLCELVADEDADGLDAFLVELKGVPGRATLRKNAKKALKRLRAADEEEVAALADLARKKKPDLATHQDHQSQQQQQARSVASGGSATPATQSESNSSSGLALASRPPPPEPSQQDLIKVVSHSHSKPGAAASATVSSAHPNRSTRGPSSNATLAATTGAKAECVLHMAPAVVGWVIGKGGQRIRDLMEESGAKVWIDQEHMSPNDPRVVYVSGNRKNVDSAVRMIKELVSKAPGIGASAATTTPAVALPQSSTPNPASGVKGDPSAAGKPAMSNPEKNDFSLITGVDAALISLNSTPILPVGAQSSFSPVKLGGEKMKTTGDILHEMTCEACFVPLLIGRRGWTIKHIQDSSGARVDIDQSVTPRKIKISGSNDNVQAAIRMVRDVLSYPHAQLQGASPAADFAHKQSEIQSSLRGLDADAVVMSSTAESHDMHHATDGPIGTQSNTTTVEAGNQFLSPNMHPSPVPADDRAHTPPPSSLINIGDAKSTISASSSLSSTPEPSMASTSKGHYGAVSNGPLFPADFGGTYPQQPPTLPNPNVFNPQSGLHQMNIGAVSGNRSGLVPGPAASMGPHSPHVPSQMFPNGMPGVGMASPRYSLPPALPRTFPQQQQHQHRDPSMLLGSTMSQHLNFQPQPSNLRHMTGLTGGLHQQNSPFSRQPDPHQALHQNIPLDFSTGGPAQPTPIHLRQQSAFHPSSQKQFHPSGAPNLGGSTLDRPINQGNYVPPGMWSGKGTSIVLGSEALSPGQQLSRQRLADSFERDGLPLPSLNGQGNMLQPTPPVDLGSALLGLPGVSVDSGVNGGFRQGAIQPIASVGRDDSRMVDSLFGPPQGIVQEEKSVLPGFSGLSLDDGINAGVWRGSVPNKWEGGETQNLSADFKDDQKGSSDLFAAIQPTLAAHEIQHPSRSRFIWGAPSNDSQGQSP